MSLGQFNFVLHLNINNFRTYLVKLWHGNYMYSVIMQYPFNTGREPNVDQREGGLMSTTWCGNYTLWVALGKWVILGSEWHYAFFKADAIWPSSCSFVGLYSSSGPELYSSNGFELYLGSGIELYLSSGLTKRNWTLQANTLILY